MSRPFVFLLNILKYFVIVFTPLEESVLMTTSTKSKLKVADEVWISTALLHCEHPDRTDFSLDEIVERATREGLYGSLRPGVYVHAVQHCVANRRPNPMVSASGFSTSSASSNALWLAPRFTSCARSLCRA